MRIPSMFPTRAALPALLGIALLLFGAGPVAAAVGTEQRCTDLGNACICSEPMDAGDNVPSTGTAWDPSDSPNATECTGVFPGQPFTQSGGKTVATSTLDGHGGSNPPNHVYQTTASFTNLHGATDISTVRPSARRYCTRWYMRYGHDYVPAGPTNNNCPAKGKVLDFNGPNSKSGHQWVINDFNAALVSPGACPAPGQSSLFKLDTDELPAGYTDKYFIPGDVTPNECRADANGNGVWCRFEFCAGGTLGSPGSRYADVRVTHLASGAEAHKRTESAPYSNAHYYQVVNVWNNLSGPGAMREFSHFMEASWSNDAGQWIGPASELEGNAPPPPPPPPDPEPDPDSEPDPGPDPAPTGVLFSDDFEGDLASIMTNWGNGSSGNISLASDTPSSSAGSQSIELDAGSGGTSYLFRQLPQNYDRLYYRYYVKYEGQAYHHTGGMIGGYDPPTSYPQGDAGLKGVRPNGDRLLNLSFEAVGETAHRLDFYNNWIDMQGADFQGLYYGRHLLEDLNLAVPSQWTCVELMVALNSPVTEKNGELTVWIDGVETASFRPGNPNGFWDQFGNWQMDTGSPGFEGFMWRDTTSLGLNWVKIQNYNAVPRVWFDDVVVSTERVGCNGSTPPPPPPTGGNLALTASASVNGTNATVSATAENASGPYNFLFDCTDDGNWDSPILDTVSQASVQHECAYGAAGSFDVKIQVWDHASGDVVQEVLPVTVGSSSGGTVGQPGRPYLVNP